MSGGIGRQALVLQTELIRLPAGARRIVIESSS